MELISREAWMYAISVILPNVSTQIRSAIANVYSALSHMPKDESTAPYLSILIQSYFRLQRLAWNFSDAAELSTSALPQSAQSAQSVDISALVRALYDECAPLARQCGLTLELSCDTASAPLTTATNATTVRRILYQLLSNSFKYTPSGGTVTLKCRAGARNLILTVQDSGSITDQALERLQQETLPLSESRIGDGKSGLGLGLTLARSQAQALGGQLLIESHPEGASFSLTLPIRAASTSAAQPAPFTATGGFPPRFVELSDALPADAFLRDLMEEEP